jgi:hypothetical protein
MSIPKGVGRDYLSGEDGQAALQSLTAIERLTCKRLIARQFSYWPKIQVALARYGPEGTVRLCAAPAIQVYLLSTIVVTVPSAIAAEGAVASTGGGLVVILFVVGICRVASAARSGTRWRDARQKAFTAEGP